MVREDIKHSMTVREDVNRKIVTEDIKRQEK